MLYGVRVCCKNLKKEKKTVPLFIMLGGGAGRPL